MAYEPFQSMRDAVNYKEAEGKFSLAEALDEKNKVESYALGSGVHNTLSGLTFSLSSLISSPFLDDETKKGLLNYKVRHPVLSAVEAGGGAFLGTLFTGGLAAGAGTIGRLARGYEALQGVAPTKTFGQAAKGWAIGNATMATVDMVDTASLDPSFLVNNSGHIAGNILESAAYGAAFGVGLKGIGRTYAKFVKGEEFFEKAPIPETNRQVGQQSDEFEGFFSPKLKDEKEFNKFFTTDIQGDHYSQNISTMSNMLRIIGDNEAIRVTGGNPSMDSRMYGEFLSEMVMNEKYADRVASGQIDQMSLFQDWRREIQLQGKYKAYDLNPKDINASIQTSIENEAGQTGKQIIEQYRNVRNTAALARNEAKVKYFQDPSNLNLADLTSQEGMLGKIESLIDNIENPKIDPTNPAAQSGSYQEAVRQLAIMRNENPSLFREIKGEFEVFKKSVVRENPIFDFFGEKTGNQYELRPGVTPEHIYDSMQNYRQGFNKRVADIQKKSAERFEIGNPAVDALWSGIKGELFTGMENMFGTFGGIASSTSKLIDMMGNEERKILLNLTKGKTAQLPENFIMRENAIYDAFSNIGKVNSRGSLTDTPGYVTGWMKGVQTNTGEAIRQIYSALPNQQVRAQGEILNRLLGSLPQLADDARVVNDDFIKSLYEISKKSPGKKAGKEYIGDSFRVRVTRIAKDLAEGVVNPATNRYALQNAVAILFDGATVVGRRLFKMASKTEETASAILMNKLRNISDLGVKRTRMIGSIKSMSNALLNLETLDKVGAATRNQFISYQARADSASSIDEINKKFDTISKNISDMRANPSEYVQRLDYELSSVRSVSSEVADASTKKILEQIGLVGQILPEQPQDIYYKKAIPLSHKATFLDNYEALTNPDLMVQKMRYGTITQDQIKITQTSYPDIWEKIITQVRTDLSNQNPSQEARSRAYAMFGIQDTETLSKSQQLAQEMLMQQFEAQRPKSRTPKVPTIRQPRVKSLSVQGTNLTPQGVKN